MKAFFDMMHDPPRKLVLFGAACTHVTDPMAKASKHWNLAQVRPMVPDPHTCALHNAQYTHLQPEGLRVAALFYCNRCIQIINLRTYLFILNFSRIAWDVLNPMMLELNYLGQSLTFQVRLN